MHRTYPGCKKIIHSEILNQGIMFILSKVINKKQPNFHPLIQSNFVIKYKTKPNNYTNSEKTAYRDSKKYGFLDLFYFIFHILLIINIVTVISPGIFFVQLSLIRLLFTHKSLILLLLRFLLLNPSYQYPNIIFIGKFPPFPSTL